MKISCEIIRDLLPLYYDAVCSNESKALIEEHLAECDNCKAELLSMGETIPVNSMEQNLSEAETLKELSGKWRKGKMKSFLKGMIIVIATVAAVVALISIFGTVRISF